MKLEILLSGILMFEGPKGGFFSVVVFGACLGCLIILAAATALFSCFCLVFLSSPSWFSSSRTC